MNQKRALEKLHVIDNEYRHLQRILAALQWDQETYLPEKGVEERAEQLALIEGIAHQRLVNGETAALLEDAGSVSDNPRGSEDALPVERDFLRVMRRRYDKEVRLPADFVSDAARAQGLSQPAWAEARRDNDYQAFLPHLRAMIDISRKKAEYWGYSGASRYDGLLDTYEPGMGASEIGALFNALRARLVLLLQKIRDCPPPDTSFLKTEFSVPVQEAFNVRLLDYLGFDRQRGRLDTSAHPFTTTLGTNDIRITTRYFPANPLSGIFSVIHETGHALYEMGFPPELCSSSLADGASMSVHESQSRLWENVIGRSRPFWQGLYPVLSDFFPHQLKPVGLDAFCRAINEVKPSLIRVDADEVSYSLHIILRFELEKKLISGELAPENLCDAWRQYTREYLGLESETDSDGVLQDVHWSMGAFGYFPSYALGNLYGLQIFEKLTQDIPEYEELIAGGQFGRLHTWLGDNVYHWGARLEPGELLEKITGGKVNGEPFIHYLEDKYSGLYGF
jgi:carboxypeptidase Taq